MKVTGFPDLTIDTLRELFGDARISIKHSIQTNGKAIVSLFFGNNRWRFDKPKACQEPIASITFTVADLHGNPYIYADMLMQEVWKREFPVSAKLREIQPLSQKCGELLNWLSSKEILLAKYHTHTTECCQPEHGIDCGLAQGQLCRYTTNTYALLAEFFEIDTIALEAEKERMLEEARS